MRAAAMLSAALAAVSGVTACGPVVFTIPKDASTDASSTDAAAEDAVAGDAIVVEDAGDAGVDAGSDVGTSDAGDRFTLVVTNQGRPAPGLIVVFHGADGRVIETATTSSDGRAVGTITNDGIVTIAYTAPEIHVLKSIFGVQPGQSLPFELSPNLPVSNVGRLVATLPSSFAGAQIYQLSLGCRGPFDIVDPAQPLSVDIPDVCVGLSGRLSIVATAVGADGLEQAFSAISDHALVPTGTTAVSLPAWRTDFRSVAISAENAPPFSETMTVQMKARIDDLEFRGKPRSIPIAPAATGTIAALIPNIQSADGVVLVLGFNDSRTDSYSVLYEQNLTPPSTTIDLSQAMFPPIVYDGLDASVVTRPRIRWHTEPCTPDGALLFLRWRKASSPRDFVAWTAFIPAQATYSIRLPELPESLAHLRPASQDAFFAPAMMLAEVDTLLDYRDFLVTFGRGVSLADIEHNRARVSTFNLQPDLGD